MYLFFTVAKSADIFPFYANLLVNNVFLIKVARRPEKSPHYINLSSCLVHSSVHVVAVIILLGTKGTAGSAMSLIG